MTGSTPANLSILGLYFNELLDKILSNLTLICSLVNGLEI